MAAVSETPGSIDDAIADVEEQLSVAFGRARQMWKESAAQIHPDLQPVGYKILGTIVRLGTTNAQTLSSLLEVDKSVVSRQVRVLEDIQMVTSRADEADGRARVLSPTQQAVEKVRVVRSRQQKLLRDLLRSRPEDELRAFASMLHLLNEGR